MCDYCKQYECPPACPSYSGHSTALGDAAGACAFCDANVYADDEYYTREGKILCAECAEELISPELLDFLECKNIKEFFDMLW